MAQETTQLLKRLNTIGISLSAERDTSKLLALILREARSFTHAEAGSLYIREGDSLVCIIAQNDYLSRRNLEEKFKNVYVGLKVPISKESIAGYAAATGTTLNIPNVHAIPGEKEYRFNKKSDEEHGYRTQSMLAIPLIAPDGEIIGVLQLINAVEEPPTVVPFSPALEELIRSLASQAAVSIKNAKLLGDIKNAHLNTILRLSVAAEYKDDDTANHLRRISVGSVMLAEKLKLPHEDVEILAYASPMHDIGKIGIPDSILRKPGKLTPEEYDEIKKHTEIGAKILEGSDMKLFLMAREIALSHHEKFNGTGYPRGLKGKEIPLTGRIVALPDVFDALLSKRAYKPAFPLEKCLEIIKSESGRHFDPDVVRVFLESLDAIVENYRKEGML